MVIKQLLAKSTILKLRSLVRILIRFEVSHSEFTELSKKAYVDAAKKYFSIPNRKTTYSRLSVLTGLSRKEVVRVDQLEEGEVSSASAKRSLNRAAFVISGWLSDKEFINDANQPDVLPIWGEGVSFEKLVLRYGGNVTVRSVLDELQRIKAISIINQDKVKLIRNGYIPSIPSEKIDILSSSTANLLDTAIYNLDNESDPRFQRQLVYSDLAPSVVQEFKKYSNKKSLELLIDYNKWLDDKQKQVQAQPTKEKSTKCIGVGIYYFED